jgi:hypothetical protein
MSRAVVRLLSVFVFSVAAASVAFAQASSTAGISGVVVDSDGGVLSGADVIVRNIKREKRLPPSLPIEVCSPSLR